jgi:hypothetical protein
MYPLRWFTLFVLDESKGTFAFRSAAVDMTVSADKINWIALIIFFIILFCLAIIIPKNLAVKPDFKYEKLIYGILYVMLALQFSLIVTGSRMGAETTNLQQMLIAFIYSFIPIDFFFLLIFIFSNKHKKILLIVAVYIILSFMTGSKSGFIHIALSLYCAYILKGGKIFSVKYIIVAGLLIIMYPVFTYFGYLVRLGQSFSLASFISVIQNKEIIMQGLLEISCRISGIDVLMIPPTDHSAVFSSFNIVLYLLKGLFTANVIDSLLLNDSRSVAIGRVFAEDFLGQDRTTVNGYEPTLYGIIHFSNTPVTTILVLLITVIGVLFIFNRYKNKWIVSSMLVFFIKNFCMIILSGTILNITITIRYLIMFVIFIEIYNLFTKSRINKYENNCIYN